MDSGHVHLIGIGGTAMGALGAMFKSLGWRVSGSDSAVYPPMSDQLEKWDISVLEGFDPAHLDPEPDLIIVGNVCRKDNPEAAAARQGELNYISLPAALNGYFLKGKKSLVMAGTHGKTTTTTMLCELLDLCGLDPSVFAGGVLNRWDSNFKLGAGEYFVIEGDEYDSAYFEKSPKFLQYNPFAAVITSLEHDHIDIYPDFASYLLSFVNLAGIIDSAGMLVLSAQVEQRDILEESCAAPVVTYGIKGDGVAADWTASVVDNGVFDLSIRGQDAGRWSMPHMGHHNVRNAMAALIVAHEVAGVELEMLRQKTGELKGVKRRQELAGIFSGVRVYDDFAHHPTAVRETLGSIRAAHPDSRIAAAFEPRSATACRTLHQKQYVTSFDAVDLAVIAPVARDLPEDEKLDTPSLEKDLKERGVESIAADSIDAVVNILRQWSREEDVIAVLSNGSFGGLIKRLEKEL